MASGSGDAELLNQLNTLANVGVVGDLTDGQLLQRLLTAGDDAAQALLTVLVERHGPMVLSVCRQVLGDPHDAQDAFQATFLVLARKAGTINKADSAASWLYGVALRVAARAKGDAARRRDAERRGAAMKATEAGSGLQPPVDSWPELHEEIARLPAHYREPVVLCYLEGLSTEVAAQRIGCPRGTVLSRLSRAREQLRGRLTRRGLSAALLASATAPAARAAVPPALLEATARAALQFAGRRTAEAGLASATATTLARGVIHAMTISKLKTLGAAFLACALAAGGVQALAQLDGNGGAEQAAPANDDRQALGRKIDQLQAQLDESVRRNDSLRKQLEGVRAELEALRRPGAQATPRKTVDAAAKVEIPASASQGAATEAPGSPQIIRAGSSFVVASPAGDLVKVYDTTTGTSRTLLKPEGRPERDVPEPAGVGRSPTVFQFGGSILVVSPDGARAVVYDTRSRSVRPLPPLTTSESPLEILPITGTSVAALLLRGPKITRIAAADAAGGWHIQDLREPAKGDVSPTVGTGVASYTIGRYAYAFSSQAKRWDVAELPKGILALPRVGTGVTAEGGGHIFTFDRATGKWAHLDLNVILSAPDDQEKNVPRPDK